MELENKEKLNSCEISVNAKGKYSGKVKVYNETITEAVKTAVEKAEELGLLIQFKNKENEWRC